VRIFVRIFREDFFPIDPGSNPGSWYVGTLNDVELHGLRLRIFSYPFLMRFVASGSDLTGMHRSKPGT
jgi:hypothetical protein